MSADVSADRYLTAPALTARILTGRASAGDMSARRQQAALVAAKLIQGEKLRTQTRAQNVPLPDPSRQVTVKFTNEGKNSDPPPLV
jgi:hypothetical protein